MVPVRAQSLNSLTFVSLLPSVGSNAKFQNINSVIIQNHSHARKNLFGLLIKMTFKFYRFIIMFLIYKSFFKVVFDDAIKQGWSRAEMSQFGVTECGELQL